MNNKKNERLKELQYVIDEIQSAIFWINCGEDYQHCIFNALDKLESIALDW